MVNNLTNRVPRRQRLALSAQLPAHLVGRRVQRPDPIGVDGMGGKITREPGPEDPVALGEVFEESRGTGDVPVLGGQQREPKAIRFDFLIAAEVALGKLARQ